MYTMNSLQTEIAGLHNTDDPERIKRTVRTLHKDGVCGHPLGSCQVEAVIAGLELAHFTGPAFTLELLRVSLSAYAAATEEQRQRLFAATVLAALQL